MIWVAAALVLAASLFVPGLLEQFESPKIAAVRVCGFGALGLGLFAGRAGRPAAWTPLDRTVVAWLAVETLATVFSISPRVSLLGETRQGEGLLTSLALVGLYFAARDAFVRPGRLRGCLHLMLGLATLVGLYAVLQAAGLDPMRWRREAVYAGVYARPFATLGHPNLLGVLSAAGAALAVALAASPHAGLARAIPAGAALVLVAVTVLTLSRAAWLGLGAGILAATVLALRERRTLRLTPRALALGAAAVLLAGLAIAVVDRGGLLARRFAELLAGGGGSGSSRLEIWRAALAAWQARPLLGQGPDAFEMVFPRFQTPDYWRLEWSGLPFHAHSIHLHTLATRGIVGLLAALAWAVALAAAARAAGRRRGEGAVPGLVPATVGLLLTLLVAGSFGALGISGALLVVVTSAMLATAAEGAPVAGRAHGVRQDRPAPARRKGRRPRIAPGGRGAAGVGSPGARREGAPGARQARRWSGWIAAAILAVAAFQWGFTGLRASRAGSAAQAFMTADPPRAVRASARAVALAPHDDRLWRMHAQTLLWLTTVTEDADPVLGEAEAAAQRAVTLAPARAENRIILARALATREAHGDTAARVAAEAAFRSSFTLAPMDGLALMEYADHEVLLGRAGPALEAARRAVALYPGEGPAHAVLARAHLAAGAPDSARAALERSLAAGWRDPRQRQAAGQMLDGLRDPASSGGPLESATRGR